MPGVQGWNRWFCTIGKLLNRLRVSSSFGNELPFGRCPVDRGLHYAQVTTEDLRPIMKQVEDAILRRAEQRTDNIVSLRSELAA